MGKTPLKRTLLCASALLCMTSAMAAAPIAAPAKPAATQTITTAPVANATPASTSPASTIPAAPDLSATGYVLMDADTGMVLAQKNMNQRMQPASLTKLMTLYITSRALQNKQIKLTDMVRVSDDAWRTGGSRMFIKDGSTVSVQDLIDGIIVASGNDACVALSEYVGGNETTFVDMMNKAAAQLGMTDTHYVDSTGLPDPQHYSTPYNMALLTRAIITQFPEYYGWYKQKWITYNGIKQPNRNRLLWRDTSVDGLKTGHTEEAGYCLISSALRDGTRLISVIMGTPTDAKRSDDSEALLNYGFRFYRTHKVFEANQALANPRVLYGKNKTVPAGLAQPLYVTIPKNTYAQLKPQIVMNDSALHAPIKKGDVVGTLTIQLHKNVITSAPLVALQDDAKGNIFSRLWDHITSLI